MLDGRGLHEVGGRREHRAGQTAVEGDLGGAHGVDHDAGGVRRIPHLQLVFEAQRDIAEGRALEAHECELAIVEPGHIVGRTDVHVVRIHLMGHHGGDGARLRDLLGLEARTLQHVHEVHVAAHIELVGAVETHTTVFEQAGEHTVRDRGADLALDVVADDRHAGIAELLGPLRVGGDEHGQAVDEGHARIHGGLGVGLVGLLGTHRQVGDEYVDLLVAQHLGHVDRIGVGLFDHLTVVLAQTIVGRATQHFDAQIRHVGELDRVVLRRFDGFRQILADLQRVHIECGDEFDVTHAISAEIVVHQTGNLILVLRVFVVFNALHQRRSAIANASDSYTNAHL